MHHPAERRESGREQAHVPGQRAGGRTERHKDSLILRHWLQVERTQGGRVLDLRGGPPRAAAQLRVVAGASAGGLASARRLPGLRSQGRELPRSLQIATSGIWSVLYCTAIQKKETKAVKHGRRLGLQTAHSGNALSRSN